MNAVEKTGKLIEEVASFIDGSPWRNQYSDRLKLLSERLNYPCELAVVGRVKAGKSSFLNALLGEDLALVGNTETTATINFFKFGTPPDESNPVKIVWADGREEWKSRRFLDSLQGNDRETLEKANNIDHLEYFVPNPILSNITLIDTPGTGALVNEHEQRTSDYLTGEYDKLRKKHEKQSIALKSKADAVVVITERVPTSSTSELIARFSESTSSFNSLGVMTKIDMEEKTAEKDWERRCGQYSQMLRNKLNAIVPVSAGVYHAAKELHKKGELKKIQEKIRLIPAEDYDEVFDGNRTNFLTEGDEYDSLFTSYGLPYSTRAAMVSGIEWKVFYKIADELYRSDYEDALANLIRFSGMEKVRNVLERQFFNRSRVIRCAKIAESVKQMLDEITIRHLYDLRFNSTNRDIFLRIISESNAPADVKESFREFVGANIPTQTEYHRYEKELEKLTAQAEDLLKDFGSVDRNAEALLLLDKYRGAFSDEEIDEIELLLGKRTASDPAATKAASPQRQLYWRSRRNMAFNNEVKRIIEIILARYESL